MVIDEKILNNFAKTIAEELAISMAYILKDYAINTEILKIVKEHMEPIDNIGKQETQIEQVSYIPKDLQSYINDLLYIKEFYTTNAEQKQLITKVINNVKRKHATKAKKSIS